MIHSFDVDVAALYGVNAAILLQNIYYWCEHNRLNEKHYYDGEYWTYNSRKAFAEQFPYMGDKQIRSALGKLKDEGLIITGCYNNSSYDRTTWYAVTEKGRKAIDKTADSTMPKGPMEKTKRANGKDSKGQPIPDIKPDISTDSIDNDDNNAGARACENPFGYTDDSIPERADTVYSYAMDNLLPLGHRAMEELVSFVEDLSEPVVRHAIDNALDNGVRTWSYVRTILNSYVDASVKTVGDVKAIDEKFANRKTQSEKGRGKPTAQKTQAQLESEKFWSNVPVY